MSFRSVLLISTAASLISPLFAENSNNPTYLALGDSVTFGLDVTRIPSPETAFTGYPEILSDAKHVQHVKKEVNAACPGETSASFLDENAVDNNLCHPGLAGIGYKAAFGLHTNYDGSQANFAMNQLRSEKQIGLVTINIGGNDLLLLQARCNMNQDCILAGLPTVLLTYGRNLTGILRALRVDAKYKETIVLVTYYSPDYRNPLQTGGIFALNAMATEIAKNFDVKIADGFAAFMAASPGGDTCAAKLLNKLPDGTCDVHPSPTGQKLLADTVLAVIGKNGNDREDNGGDRENKK